MSPRPTAVSGALPRNPWVTGLPSWPAQTKLQVGIPLSQLESTRYTAASLPTATVMSILDTRFELIVLVVAAMECPANAIRAQWGLISVLEELLVREVPSSALLPFPLAKLRILSSSLPRTVQWSILHPLSRHLQPPPQHLLQPLRRPLPLPPSRLRRLPLHRRPRLHPHLPHLLPPHLPLHHHPGTEPTTVQATPSPRTPT